MASSWIPRSPNRRRRWLRKKRVPPAALTFGPMLDIAGMPAGAASSRRRRRPLLARHAAAQVRGFQGPSLGTLIVLPVPSTLQGTAADGGRDYDQSTAEGRLRNVYFPPFEAAVKAGVGTFMSAYMDLNDVPASGNRFLLRGILRDEWASRVLLSVMRLPLAAWSTGLCSRQARCSLARPQCRC